MSVIHAPKKPELDLRMLLFPITIGMLMFVLLLRLWYFQVVKASDLADKADNYNSEKVSQPAPRGLIFDRNGVLLAGVRSEVVVTATPFDVRKNEWVIEKLAAMLNTDPKKLRDKMEKDGWRPRVPVPIFTGVPMDIATKIAESRDDLPGIGVDSEPMRYYTDTTDFAHLMGYVWTPDANDVKRLAVSRADTPPYVGKTGIEKAYDPQLLGKPGVQEMEVDAKRRPIRLVKRDVPDPGDQLTLTIDADLQRYAAAILKGYKGAVVAMDPKTGEVLCAVSSPTYDTSLFLTGISKTDFDGLLSNPDKPMFNRALSAHYAPGSTFKIITSIAAQEEGKFDPNYPVTCEGGYKIGRGFVKCLGHHGTITYADALAKSCNTYFCDLAYRIGETALRRACAETGLGTREGVDVPNESPGIVPTERWVAKRKLHWYQGDTVNFGIGQGYVEATPLQMSNLMAFVANNGVNYRPHVVRAFRHPGQSQTTSVEPEILHKIDLPGDFWATLKSALVGVIERPYGTASVCRMDGVTWGGKTGSAEKHGQAKTNSWFVGYAPAEDTKIVVAVVVEGVGHGADFAAPFAREIVHHYLFRKSAAPSKAFNASSTNAPPDASPAP